VSPRELSEIADTVHAQGVLALVRTRDAGAEELIRAIPPPPLLVALDGIADPGNLGTIVRTCDWFGAGGILLGKTSVDIFNPKVIRSTMGGIFHLPVAPGVDLPAVLRTAKAGGYGIVVADPRGEAGEEGVTFPARTVLVFGSEAHGVSDDLSAIADTRVAIRRSGRGESLNVSVSCGILLAAYRRSAAGGGPHR
jgi:TrmH family RNA methyltransferase